MQKILVVDDDEGIVEVVQIVLEGEGYAVQTSLDDTFIEHLTDDLPDLILLDVLLSGTDGREICTRLKSNEATKYIPIVMLSAHSDTGKLADSSGADGFLEKPFDVDALIETVQHYISATPTQREQAI